VDISFGNLIPKFMQVPLFHVLLHATLPKEIEVALARMSRQ
jgi:hypothetical protein